MKIPAVAAKGTRKDVISRPNNSACSMKDTMQYAGKENVSYHESIEASVAK